MKFAVNDFRIGIAILISISLTLIPSCGKNGKETGPAKVYKFPCLSKVNTLDPIRMTNQSEDSIANQIYDSLVTMDDKFTIQPEIAERWEYDKENTVYTFHIRKGVKFHNGGEVKSADVKASFTRLADKDIKTQFRDRIMWVKGTSEYYRKNKKEVSGLKVIDDYTLEIHLSEEYLPFLSLLTTTAFSVLPADVLEQNWEDISYNAVGSGPFIYSSSSTPESILLEANENYYFGKPFLDQIIYKIIDDPAKQLVEYRAGNLDHIWVSNDMAEDIIKDNTIDGQMETYPVNIIYCYIFNLDKNQFGGSREPKRMLRQAINYAIDRESICKEIFNGRCIPSSFVIPPGMCGFANPLSDVLGFKRDIEKARDLLDKAGYPGGNGVGKVSLYTTYESPNIDIAESVKKNLNEIGLEVEIIAKDKENYLKAVKSDAPALFSYEWEMQVPSLDDLLSMFHSTTAGTGRNFAHMTRENIDQLIDKTRTTDNTESLNELYMELENQLWFDSPWVYMFQERNSVLVKPYVKGLREQFGQFDYRESISHVRMEKVDIDQSKLSKEMTEDNAKN